MAALVVTTIRLYVCDGCRAPDAGLSALSCFDCAGLFCAECWNEAASACNSCASTDPGDRWADREDDARFESFEQEGEV